MKAGQDEIVNSRKQTQTHRIVESILDNVAEAIDEVRVDMKSKRMDGDFSDEDLETYTNKIRLSQKLISDSYKYLVHEREEHIEFED